MPVSHETTAKSKTKLTYAHYTHFPGDGIRHEIIDGIITRTRHRFLIIRNCLELLAFSYTSR